MQESTTKPAGGFQFRFHPRILGTPAPVFPGFEIDISAPVGDEEKPDAVWHRERAREMFRKHPEIKGLTGPTLSTAWWCVLFASLQIGIAVAMGWVPWWVCLLVAWAVGSWVNINLFSLAHECNHSLVFKGDRANRWLFTFTSLPMFLSGHHTWWIEHHVHHNDLGAKKDFIKRRRSFFLLTRTYTFFGLENTRICRFFLSFLTPLFFPYALIMLTTQVVRSAIGLMIYGVGCVVRRSFVPSQTALAVLADEHLVSGYERLRLRHWAVIYPALSLTLVGVLFFFVGWKAVLYLLLSALFSTGFMQPFLMGLILSNSHFHGHKQYQPSSSCYTWVNWITFNFGYHTEHHDFCTIPWSRLPRLREIAPEFYDELIQTHSYSMLAMRFVFGSHEGFEQQFDSEIHRNQAMTEQAGAET